MLRYRLIVITVVGIPEAFREDTKAGIPRCGQIYKQQLREKNGKYAIVLKGFWCIYFEGLTIPLDFSLLALQPTLPVVSSNIRISHGISSLICEDQIDR